MAPMGSCEDVSRASALSSASTACSEDALYTQKSVLKKRSSPAKRLSSSSSSGYPSDTPSTASSSSTSSASGEELSAPAPGRKRWRLQIPEVIWTLGLEGIAEKWILCAEIVLLRLHKVLPEIDMGARSANSVVHWRQCSGHWDML